MYVPIAAQKTKFLADLRQNNDVQIQAYSCLLSLPVTLDYDNTTLFPLGLQTEHVAIKNKNCRLWRRRPQAAVRAAGVGHVSDFRVEEPYGTCAA